jgi:hypothetical protein
MRLDTGAAVSAAVAVAREQGLAAADPVLLHARHSVVVHLAPAPVVARVALTGSVLGEDVATALGVAAYAASQGAPVASPADELDPGPHERHGAVVSFWRHVAHDGPVDAAAAGDALRALHEAIRTAPIPLPSFDPRPVVERVAPLLEPRHAEALLAAAARVELPPGEARPLHGDAHLGNVLQSAAGPVWIDLEGPRAGPVEWDLALLAHRTVLWGECPGDTEAALGAYGPHDAALVEELAGPVGLWLATLSCLTAGPDRAARARAESRLDWVRSRYALEM